GGDRPKPSRSKELDPPSAFCQPVSTSPHLRDDRFKLNRSCSFFYRRRARRHKGVIDLANAPRDRQRIASDPTRLVRRQEHRDRRYIVRLSGPPERRPRHSLLLVIVADGAHRLCTLSIDQARLD